MTGRLEGRVAVVTGAGRGIGRALAETLAEHGAAVVLSSRSGAELNEVVSGVRSRGGRALSVIADALDAEHARDPVSAAMTTFGAVDILVNNVGGRDDGCDDTDPWRPHDGLFERLLTLNLTTAWWTTTAALPYMRERGHGRVINIGSGLSQRAGGSMAYTAAKHGLVGLTRSLALATGPYGITVNCLCPGWTETSAVDWSSIGTRSGIGPEEARGRAEAENAQRRILAADELGGALVMLASDDGKGITGQVLHVDGGWKI